METRTKKIINDEHQLSTGQHNFTHMKRGEFGIHSGKQKTVTPEEKIKASIKGDLLFSLPSLFLCANIFYFHYNYLFLSGMEASFLLDVFSLNSLISRSSVSRDSANTYAQEKQTEKHCVQTSNFLLCVSSLCCSKVVPTSSSSNHFRALHLGLYINCILVSIYCNIEGCIRALQNYLGKKEMSQSCLL